MNERVFPSFGKFGFDGLPVELSMMEEQWAGDYVRDEVQKWPELFFYSKNDWYLPYDYLEKDVLSKRKAQGRPFTAKCWDKSPHVAHLRAHKKEYQNTVLNFLYKSYFQELKLKNSSVISHEKRNNLNDLVSDI